MSSQKVCTDKTRRGVRFEVCLGIKNIYVYLRKKYISFRWDRDDGQPVRLISKFYTR